MTPQDVHDLVVATGRVSAGVFFLALLGAALSRHAVQLWLAFLAVHTVHFAAVRWFAVANDGRDLFPGGMSLAAAGGWPLVLGSGTFFYVLALTAPTAARAGQSASRWLHIAGSLAAAIMGLMFLATYVPLVQTSVFFVLPVAAIAAALIFYLMRMIRGAAGKSP